MGGRIWMRRAYDTPTRNDGLRVLIDRLWPRGVTKEAARIDLWMKDIAPSDELRKWFAHDVARWDEFRTRYRKELADHPDDVDQLVDRAAVRRLTLVFGARDQQHNNAVVLRELLDERLAARAG